MVNFKIKAFCSTKMVIMGTGLSRQKVKKKAENKREMFRTVGVPGTQAR